MLDGSSFFLLTELSFLRWTVTFLLSCISLAEKNIVFYTSPELFLTCIDLKLISQYNVTQTMNRIDFTDFIMVQEP